MSRPLAVVTGASRGIGREIALRLATDGYDLAALARSADELEQLRGECEQRGARAVAIVTDVSDESSVVRAFEGVDSAFGRLDVLVNNAGVGRYSRVAETSVEDWDLVMGVNLRGAFLCSREAMRRMAGARAGAIINIASVVGLKGYANQGAYAASKHGMVGLSKVMAEEARADGIRVHVICPGGVATDMVAQARPDIPPEELLQVEDVAELVSYLLKLPARAMIDLVHLRRSGSSPF